MDPARVGEEHAESEVVFGAGVDEGVVPHPRDEGALFVPGDEKCGSERKQKEHFFVLFWQKFLDRVTSLQMLFRGAPFGFA